VQSVVPKVVAGVVRAATPEPVLGKQAGTVRVAGRGFRRSAAAAVATGSIGAGSERSSTHNNGPQAGAALTLLRACEKSPKQYA
jgi:hypothetical protein